MYGIIKIILINEGQNASCDEKMHWDWLVVWYMDTIKFRWWWRGKNIIHWVHFSFGGRNKEELRLIWNEAQTMSLCHQSSKIGSRDLVFLMTSWECVYIRGVIKSKLSNVSISCWPEESGSWIGVVPICQVQFADT